MGIWNGTVYALGVGAFYPSKEHGPRQSWLMPRKRSIQGKWQLEPPFKELLKQIKKSSGISCSAHFMRHAYYAGKSGDWKGYKKAHWDKNGIGEWAFIEVKESYDKVAWEDIGRLGIAQDILRKSTDFLRRIIALASGVGGVTLSQRTIWWGSLGHGDGNNRKKKQRSWWCAACRQFDWRVSTGYLVRQDCIDPLEAKCFCDNMINSLKLLMNQQRDGDSPVDSIVTGLREKKSYMCYRWTKGVH